MLHVLPRSMPGSVPSPVAVPPGSIAATVRALPSGTQPTAAFRDAACAALRLTRERGRIECDALAALFEDELTTDDRRSLILDLLASAGTPEAQVVMRRLLALGVARRNSRTFASFVQRLGFMERPDGATLRFLISVYAESKHEAHEVRAACAYALGAGAGRAHVWGLTDAAMRASEVLRHDLLRATSASEKCALVTALGNAALESDVPVILRFVEDPESRVRGAAALALKKMHTREARASLLSLLTSNDENVAESALSALFEQMLAHEEIVRLAELVLAGRTPLALDSRILRLIVTQKLHVVGQLSLDTVEDAIHLLLSRIEAQALRAGSAPRSHVESQNQSGYARRSVASSEPPIAVGGASRSRMVPLPKTPLPYSAGYRMVSQTESNHVADTLDDAKLASLVAPSPSPSPKNAPGPRAITPIGKRTLSYGSLDDALRLSSVQSLEALSDVLPPPAATAAQTASPPASAPPTVPSMPPLRVESEIRSLSAVSVPCPIVPLAIIR